MFNIFKQKKDNDDQVSSSGVMSRLRLSLKKTRQNLVQGFAHVLLGKKEISQDVLEELETVLLSADVGVETTSKFLADVTEHMGRKELSDGQTVLDRLKSSMVSALQKVEKPLDVDSISAKPAVILVVGVNGAGKTTTIGKLAHFYQNSGKKVLLAAGDTFRAAAIEQLQVWGERNNVPVISQQMGADSASVIFDAFQSARAKKMDVLIADTAGRLHTQDHLMEELKKIKRVLKKMDENIPHETLLVLDASIGQNALSQATQFHDAIGVTGLVLTKLDGTAKGGIVFSIAERLKLPIYYIGTGEKIDDLSPFNAEDFVCALFE